MTGFIDALTAEQREWVLRVSPRRRLDRRDLVLHEGEGAESAHLILKGHLGIRMTTPRGEVGIVAIRRTGETVGEMALMPQAPKERSATVVAMSDAETLIIQRSLLTTLREQNPAVGDWLLTLLTARLRETTRQVMDALYEDVETRILRRLLDADMAFDGGELPITQQDLAAMAGSTRPTVNRVLRRAQDRGEVDLSRGRIEILDPPALVVRAGWSVD